MENYLDLSRNITAGFSGNWETTVLLLAGLVLCIFLIPLRGISFAAIAAVGAAVALLYRGVEIGSVTTVLIASGIVLTGVEFLRLRSRVRSLERGYAGMAEAVRGLQIADERRQSYLARRSVPLLPNHSEKNQPSLKLAEAADWQPAPFAPSPKLNGIATPRP